MNLHDYKIKIEEISSKFLKCSKNDIGGLISADYSNPSSIIFFVLGCIYANANESKKKEISDYINNYYFSLDDIGLNELMNFTTNEYHKDNETVKIDSYNGNEEIKKIIEEFRKLCL